MTDQASIAETVTPTDDALSHLETQYGNAVRRDDRDGYEGIIVEAGQLVNVATAIRDELGYDYLASATAVDYLGSGDHFEMVYHAYRTAGGPALVIKAQTPRDVAELPSLVPVWPGADFQEREAWDLMGIRFMGHPNLKRILMWEGFHGHPLRKDWHEAFYEQDQKPFDSRWPDGHVWRSEEHNTYGKNVVYPDDFTLEGYQSPAEQDIYKDVNLGVEIKADMATTASWSAWARSTPARTASSVWWPRWTARPSSSCSR
ncbi:MAG: NADH-quinone oxidoreductase subunit C [Chloroflexi bacterium]|nr:NADH-quinone oxidoreductase subunit C [Chloroflexota bacterium]